MNEIIVVTLLISAPVIKVSSKYLRIFCKTVKKIYNMWKRKLARILANLDMVASVSDF